MWRLLFIVQLNLALLVCPYSCQATLACADQSLDISSLTTPAAPVGNHQCGCCQVPPSTSTPDVPQDSSDNCSCGNCICYGAIRSDQQERPDLQPAGFAWDVVRNLNAVTVVSHGLWHRSVSDVPILPDSGRDAHIAHQVWQL